MSSTMSNTMAPLSQAWLLQAACVSTSQALEQDATSSTTSSTMSHHWAS
jgi:hypothetical protein